MKKIFSILAVAAIVLSMASCALGGSSRYDDGSSPMIDYVKHTVNGMWYDPETEHCWLVSTTKDGENSTVHVWTNHFDLVVDKENEMKSCSEAGIKATYALTITAELDYESCSKTDHFEGF